MRTLLTVALLLVILSLTPQIVLGQIVENDTLKSWGYQTNPHSPYLQEFCATSIKANSSHYQSIRLTKKSVDSPRYRFTLAKEVYQSKEAAESVVKEVKNPMRHSSKYSKMCNMRKAMNIGEVVYFVHSDVNYPEEQFEKMLNKLHQQVSTD
ncbi:MAG: hypothetical protein KUG78_11755 [Kangiellaceae bacterium]|nr:hypothetical protein [Kangiellaceae bacterium]